MGDRETIEKRRNDFVAAFNREDIPALSDLLSDDHIQMPPNRPAIRGKQGTSTFWGEGFRAAKSRVSAFTEDFEIAGDLATDRFRWSMETTPKGGGSTAHDEGKCVWIWRRKDGQWKLAQAIWSSDLPQSGLWSGASAAASSGSGLTAGERDEIRAIIEKRWVAASLAKDLDTCLAMCADDIVYMPADQPAVRGRTALRTWLGQVPPILRMTQAVEQVEGAADRAFIRANVAITFDIAGTPADNTFKMMCSFRKEKSGAWLIDNVCWNADRPMASGAASPDDMAGIENLLERYTAAVNAGDVNAWGACSTEDTVWMPPDGPKLDGRAALVDWMKPNFFDKYKVGFSMTYDEVQVFGAQAFARGAFTNDLTPKSGGGTIHLTGKLSNMLRRQPDGSWKFAVVIFNFDKSLAT